MTNDEARMTNETRMTKDCTQEPSLFVIRASSFIRHSDFDIRIFAYFGLADNDITKG